MTIEVIPVDQKALFYKFVAFTSDVHQVSNEISKGVTNSSITPVQYSILEYIKINQPITLSAISDCLHMSMPNTSRELKKLAGKNLCEKFTVAEDRRKQYIRLSAAGEEMMNIAFDHIEARFQERIKGASLDELKEISHALNVLHSKVFYTDMT